MSQSLEIVPYLGGSPLVATDVTVALPRKFLELVDQVVKDSQKISEIKSSADVTRVTEQQGQIMALMNSVTTAQKAAATPIASIVNAINEAGKSVNARLRTEKERFSEILSRYAEGVEAQRKTEIDAAFDQKRKFVEYSEQAKLDLEEKIKKAERTKRFAEDLAEINEASKEINRLNAQLENAKLDAEFAKTAEVIPPAFHESIVPGGRTSDKISVEIEDIAAIIAHDPTLGYFREVVKFEIKTQSVVNKVKDLIDLKKKPSLPGIKVTIKPRVDVKASVRIVTTV